MKILITSIGSNTSISIIKGLRLTDQKCILYGTDSNPFNQCAGSKFVDNFFKICTSDNEKEYTNSILKIITENKIDCVIPVHDLELVIHAKLKKLHPKLTYWCVNNESTINLSNDKKLSSIAAIKAGVNVPAIYTDMTLVQFPVIAKPLNGVSSRGIKIITQQQELDSFISKHDVSKYIVQDFISGPEYTVDCYSSYSGGFYECMPRIRIETKAGISSKGMTVKNENIKNLCGQFLDSIDYRGACNIQFIESNNEFYFIEINPRFAGAGILSYKANFNSPLFTILEAMNMDLPLKKDLNLLYNLYMVRFWEETFYEN